MTARIYTYVGPEEIREKLSSNMLSACVRSVEDVHCWISSTNQTSNALGEIIVTFIVDTNGSLWISDRRTEHIACARGRPVFAAGEISFRIDGSSISVVAATNQSTGYCPEPDCWSALQEALDSAGISHPGRLTNKYVFRRCLNCNQINIVKYGLFECGVCGADLRS